MTSPRRHFEGGGAEIVIPAYLAVTCFLLVGMRQSLTVPMTLGLSIGQFLLFAFGILWALMGFYGGGSASWNPALAAAVLGSVAAALLSYGAVTGRGTAPAVISDADRHMLTILGYAAVVFAIAAALSTSDGLLLVIKGMLVGGSLSAVFAIVQFGTGIDLAPSFRLPGLRFSDFLLVKDLMREGVVRSQGSAGHPLELAAVLTTLIPLGVGVIAAARARGERIWPWLLCTAMLTGGAVVTVSRSVVLGLGAACAVMAWRWSVGRMLMTLFGVFAAVALAWLVQLRALSAITSTIGLATGVQDPSIASRTIGAQYVFSHYQDHFWLGQGIVTYPLGPEQPVLDSEYLSKLMEGGVIGLLAYVALLAVGLVLAIRASTTTLVANAEIAGGIAGAIAVLIVMGAILDIGGFIQYWSLAWVIIALSAVAFRVCRQDRTPDHSSPGSSGPGGQSAPSADCFGAVHSVGGAQVQGSTVRASTDSNSSARTMGTPPSRLGRGDASSPPPTVVSRIERH